MRSSHYFKSVLPFVPSHLHSLNTHFWALAFTKSMGLGRVAPRTSPAWFSPEHEPERWVSAFSAYVKFNRAHILVFEIFRSHLEFALDNLQLLRGDSNPRNDAIAHLGEHLLDYFMLGLIELHGVFLQKFYAKTTQDYWAELFDHVGRILSHTAVLKPDVAGRIKSFFESRLVAANPEELKEFTFWLRAECLEPQWRVEAFRRTLRIAKGSRHATSMVTDELAKLVSVVPDIVVLAFADLTENFMTQSYFYLRPERVKIILNAGLRSRIPETAQAAKFARDNLLKAGRTEYRDLDAIKDDPHWLTG